MARYVTTKSASGASSGGSGGGGGGPTAAEVCQYACKAVCDLFCTNLITTDSRPVKNFLPVANNCYQVICHCNCWTNCFGNGFKIDLDTTKYKAFRFCFAGQRICGCCYYYMCAGLLGQTKDNPCMCCCTNTYRYTRVDKKHPVPKCACNCGCGYGGCNICCTCWIGNSESWCWCCASGCDGVGAWDFCLEAAINSRPYRDEPYAPWHYDVKWIGQKSSEWYTDYPAMCSRLYGTGYCNAYTAWSKNRSSGNYINAICFASSLPIQSALSAGNYQGGTSTPANQPRPTPNWTIWGWPCCMPMNVGVWSGSTAPTANDPLE